MTKGSEKIRSLNRFSTNYNLFPEFSHLNTIFFAFSSTASRSSSNVTIADSDMFEEFKCHKKSILIIIVAD
jgi:hypothetical protein